MHYRHVLTLIILRGHVAGVRQSGLLWNGQGIELSADHDSGAGAVLQDADDPCSADTGSHIEPEPAEILAHLDCCLLLMQRQLGIAMYVHIQGLDLRVNRIDLRLRRRKPGIGGEYWSSEQTGERHGTEEASHGGFLGGY